MKRSLQIDTPLGAMTVTASECSIVEVRFCTEPPVGSLPCSEAETPELLRQAARELKEYFAGERQRFTVPLAPQGSEFQKKVWDALQTIPYGETILIPCHRVIGYDGKLTGYAAGIGIKERLLDLEKGRQE